MAKLWLCFLLVALTAVLSNAQNQDLEQQLDPVQQKIDSFIDSKTRYVDELDKQNIYKNEKYYGITYPPKTNPHNNLFQKPTTSTTTGRPPVSFDLNAPVSLVIPDTLFANSFPLVTNASKILTDVIYNTADRAQELAEVVNSKLTNKFTFAKKFIKFTQPVWKISGGYNGGNDISSSSSSASSSSSSSSSDSSNSINFLRKRHADSSSS